MAILDLREGSRRILVPALGILVAAYYFLVLQHLAQKSNDLDAPLDTAWRKLAIAVGRSNATVLDFAAIDRELQETKHARTVLAAAARRAAARVEVGDELRARLRAPFVLVDYQNERQKLIDDFTRLSKQQAVALEPAVFTGFPEHTADVKEPTLLWAELDFVNALLQVAINAKVTAIHSLSVPVAFTNAPPTNEPPRLAEIPIQLELTAPMPALTLFLRTLPLRAEELKAQGLPEAPAGKPALFIERLLLRRQSPEKADEVRLSLRAVGFVFRP